MNTRSIAYFVLGLWIFLSEGVSIRAQNPSRYSIYESAIKDEYQSIVKNLGKEVGVDLKRGQVRFVIHKYLEKTTGFLVYRVAGPRGGEGWGVKVARHDGVAGKIDLRGDVEITKSDYSYFTDSRVLNGFLRTYEEIGEAGRAKLVGLDGIRYFVEWKDDRDNLFFLTFWSPRTLSGIDEEKFRERLEMAKPEYSRFLEYSDYLLRTLGIAIPESDD